MVRSGWIRDESENICGVKDLLGLGVLVEVVRVEVSLQVLEDVGVLEDHCSGVDGDIHEHVDPGCGCSRSIDGLTSVGNGVRPLVDGSSRNETGSGGDGSEDSGGLHCRVCWLLGFGVK